MFRSFGLDEKIAGNVREKQRALAAAETAEQYAEYWLASGGGSGTTPITCTGVVLALPGQICNNPLLTPASLPWQYNGGNVGVTYAPSTPSAMNIETTPTQGSYYSTPIFYVAYIGATPNGLGQIYQIDAAAYGATPDAAAVVEATYLVQQGVKDLGSSQ
jgi:type IV pilus assembly protein PilX